MPEVLLRKVKTRRKMMIMSRNQLNRRLPVAFGGGSQPLGRSMIGLRMRRRIVKSRLATRGSDPKTKTIAQKKKESFSSNC